MSATRPPCRQSTFAATVSRFHRNEPENAIIKSGLASPATVSRKVATAPGFVTTEPAGRMFPVASSGTLPQIQVVRPPGLMKFRPNAAPNEPGAGNRGTYAGRFSIVCLFFENEARKL